MKIIEFKLYLNSAQKKQIDHWLEILKVVWNRGLALLLWKQYYNRLQRCLEVTDSWGFEIKPVVINCYKEGKNYILYSSIAADFRLDKSKGWEVEGNVERRQVLNLVKPHWMEEPLIESYTAISLRKPFAFKRYPWLKEQSIPSVLVNDYLELVLIAAWKRYQQGKIRKPKFKKARDRANTLSSKSFRHQCKADWENNRVRLPVLGWLKLKDLSDRLTPGADISTFNLCRKPSGYYLQLGWVDAPERKKRKERKSVKIGLNHKEFKHEQSYEIPRYAERSRHLLEKEQQKLSRMEYRSNRWEKQKKKVGRIQEKIKAQRKGWQHWHSTAIADIYDDITLKETPLEPIPKPDPVIDKEGKTYDFNGAEIVAKINRDRLDAALSEFKSKIKYKLGDRGILIEEKATVSKSKDKVLASDRNLDKSISKSSGVKTKTRRRKRTLNKKRKSLQAALEPNAGK